MVSNYTLSNAVAVYCQQNRGNSKVHSKGSSVGELKLGICFSEALHLLLIPKEVRIQFGFLLEN